MSLTDLVQEAEHYLESHVSAVKDLVQLVPRIEQLVAAVERVVADATATNAAPAPAQPAPTEPAAPAEPTTDVGSTPPWAPPQPSNP